MPDKIHRFLLENLHVRGEWVKLDKAWKEIQQTTEYPKAIRNVLGEALGAISLLAASLKFKGSLILQMNDTHPVTMLVVQATSEGDLRGIARWEDEIPDDASFIDLFGKGTLAISVEPEGGGERYQSLVALHENSLAETLSGYFQQSEQLPTELWLAATEDQVAGLMLQTLPSNNVDENDWNHALTLAKTVNKEELLELDVNQLLHRLYHEEDCRLYDAEKLRFKCSCSQAKIENMVNSLGEDEALSIIKDQGSIEIDCQFCNQHYRLDDIDVKRIFSITISATSKSVH